MIQLRTILKECYFERFEDFKELSFSIYEQLKNTFLQIGQLCRKIATQATTYSYSILSYSSKAFKEADKIRRVANSFFFTTEVDKKYGIEIHLLKKFKQHKVETREDAKKLVESSIFSEEEMLDILAKKQAASLFKTYPATKKQFVAYRSLCSLENFPSNLKLIQSNLLSPDDEKFLASEVLKIVELGIPKEKQENFTNILMDSLKREGHLFHTKSFLNYALQSKLLTKEEYDFALETYYRFQ